MAELKTKKQNGGVPEFLAGIADEQTRQDCQALIALMRKISGDEPALWGTSIIGFGTYHYKYASGREADWFPIGFSPRKQNLTIYLVCGFDGLRDALAKLGPHKLGKGCLYIKRLADVDRNVLEELVTSAYASAARSA